MLDWMKGRWALVRSTIAAGDVLAFERRYMPAAFAVGAVFGVILALLTQLLAVVVVLAGGFALGYAVRAYRSYRRRVEYLRRKGETY